MTKFLVIFRDDWADEIDIRGFEVVEKDWWEKYQEKFPDKKFSDYVGSNEEIEYSGKKDYFSHFTVTELTEDEAKALKKFFPGGFGKIVWNEDFDMD